jgi:hypothetical protein
MGLVHARVSGACGNVYLSPWVSSTGLVRVRASGTRGNNYHWQEPRNVKRSVTLGFLYI